MTSESTALAPASHAGRTVALRSLAEVERFAELIYNTSLVPKEYKGKLGDVVGIIFFGLELGLNPLQALQGIMFVNGRPSVWGDTMLGLVKASGLLERFEETPPDAAQDSGLARCLVQRRGEAPVVRVFTRAMAEKAKLWGKEIWAAYPGRMLQMRARSWALRDAFSDVLKGLYSVEEARDIDLSPDAAGTYAYTPPLEPSPAAAPEAAPPAAIAEAMLADAGLSAPPVRPEPKTRPELERAIAARLRQLAPGDDATAKQERKDLLYTCWGVDRWAAVMGLDDRRLRAGWEQLKAIGREPPPVPPAPDAADAADEVPAGLGPDDGGDVGLDELDALRARYAAVGWAESYDARRAEGPHHVSRALYEEWVAVVESLERMRAWAPPAAPAGEG
jgi:hypothetical protein